MGVFMLAVGSSGANAQPLPITYNLKSAVSSAASSVVRPAVAATTAIASSTGAVFQMQPARTVTLQLTPSIASQAAWLYRGGWPLYALVDKFATNAPLDQETNCIATAVYFEARGESLEGQLAVARVIMNRAASGQYPTSWCGVVKQPAQFSFVHNGYMPTPDMASAAWRRAEGIARIAMVNAVPSLSSDVLWYHANYVAP